ncbi:long-chain-alcohol oxidase FAO2-like [Oryza brachyantha]|uniref:long-chain-alcohol oxidase FAO2-like n=1 Tax=Oryza brachyantha TaxID=4533 RepID=UPI001ADD2E72|nr:long-chain-alcohol oxidase FAO2-like [Oryza brachyantha]
MGEEDKKQRRRRRQGHPLLRGGAAGKGRRYTHGFSASQMLALAAVCGAVAPSLPPDSCLEDERHGGRGGGGGDVDVSNGKAVRDFLVASAADPPVPDEVAELMTRMCLREALALVRAVLWLLGTRLGTLALCGARCLSGRWPFVLRFAEMPLERREAALRRWSALTVLPPLRTFFLVAKVFCQYVFYSWIDESSNNPHWRAVGYSPPTDEPPAEERPEATKRPLDDGVVETINLTDASLPASLADKGLTVTDDAARNVCQVECDVVIVGSGAGGGVAAAVLAGAGHKVVVIEKGSYFTSRDYTSFEGPSMNQLYESGGFVSTMNGGGLLLAGSTVGGGTAVNWSACLKTPEHVRREWAAAHGLPLFESSEYAAAMDKVFERLGVTSGCKEEGLQNKVLRKGCEKLGYKVDAVARNSSEGHFCGSCGYGCRTGDKRGTDTTWLVDAVGRGAVILTGCKAEKLVLERCHGAGGTRSKRCVGVVARSTNPAIKRTLEVRAKVTVSAGGSLLTPVLLQRSGLTNPHIGKNLHLHPTAFAWGYFPDTTVPDLKGKTYEGGIITSLHKVESSGAGDGDGPHRAILETPLLGVAAMATQMPWVSGRDMKERMLRFGRTVHIFSLVRDRGSGTVHGERRIAYRLDEADREDMREGLRRALRVLVAAGAAEVGTHRSDGQRLRCEGLTEAALEEFLDGVTVVRGPQSRSETWSLFCSAHNMGSCRMGATARDGAVDGRGESWEAERLYVCDGSVLPTALGVNPMITIQSVAYCLASGIADSLSGKTTLKKT